MLFLPPANQEFTGGESFDLAGGIVKNDLVKIHTPCPTLDVNAHLLGPDPLVSTHIRHQFRTLVPN